MKIIATDNFGNIREFNHFIPRLGEIIYFGYTPGAEVVEVIYMTDKESPYGVETAIIKCK